MPKATSKQVRDSEAKRKAAGEVRISVSAWVADEHKESARIAGKAAFDKAVKKYLKK